MANTSRTIKVIFDGSTAGIKTAAAAAKAAIRSVGDENGKLQKDLDKADGIGKFVASVGKIALIAGAGAAGIQAVATTGVVLTQTLIALAPAALALPGIFLGGFAAMKVFSLATDGFTKALGGSDKAFQSLSQNAKDTVTTLNSFKGGLTELQQSLQQTFFQGFADQIKQTGTVLLPILQSKLGAIAQGFNQIGIAAIEAARTPFFTNALSSILDNTGVAMGKLRNTVANVLTGFVGLGTVGAQYLPRIADAIDNVAVRFRIWVGEGLESGKIQSFVDGAIAAFKQLGTIISNVGSILKEIFSGLNAGLGAGGALSGIIATTQAVKEFLATASAQAGLKSLGETIKALGDAFRGVLLEALKQLVPVLVAAGPFLQQLATTLGGALVSALQIAGPLLQGLATFLSNNAAAAAVFTVAFLAIAGVISVLISIATTVISVAAGFTALISVGGAVIGFIAEVGSAIAGLAGILVGAVGGLGAIGGAIASVFGGIVAVVTAPVTLVVAAIALIGGALVLAYNKCALFKDFVDTTFQQVGQTVQAAGAFFTGLGSSIASAFSGIVSFLTGFAQSVVDAFVSLPSDVGSIFSSIGSAISTAFNAVVGFITSIPGTVVGVFTAAGAGIAAFFTNLPTYAYNAGVAIGTAIGQILTFFINLWNSVVTATSTAFTTIVAFVVALPAQVGAAIAALAATIVAGATAAWNFLVTATTTAITATIAFVVALPGKVVAALAALGSLLTNVATTAWNAFKTTTTTVVNAVIAFIRSVPGLISSGLSALAGLLTSAATTAWNAFKSATTTAANATIAFVKSIPGLIVSAIGNLGSLLVSAGKAVIDGLLAGIKAGYNAMISFVKGIAAGIAANKGPLPYDRTVLVPAGLALMQGLLNGLQTGHSSVLDFVKSIASSIRDKMAAGAQAGLGTVVPGADASLSVVHTINDRKAQGNATDLIGSAIQQGLAQAPAPVTNVYVDPKVDALHNFINTKIEEVHREVARLVGQGTAVGFGG